MKSVLISPSQLSFVSSLLSGTQFYLGTRGNGFLWAVDTSIKRCDLDLSDHEDWIYKYLSVPSEGVYVDVGAFVGTHSVRIAKSCSARVFAFEPVQNHVDIARLNAAINQVSVEIIQAAVCGECGDVLMSIDGPNSEVRDDGESRVRGVTLDSIESLMSLDKIDVIKIDVEGLEVEVLKGAVEICRKHKPKLIIEVHSHLTGRECNGSAIDYWCSQNEYASRRIWENTSAYYYVECVPQVK